MTLVTTSHWRVTSPAHGATHLLNPTTQNHPTFWAQVSPAGRGLDSDVRRPPARCRGHDPEGVETDLCDVLLSLRGAVQPF